MNNIPAIIEQRGIDSATWNALSNVIYPGAKPETIAFAVDYCKSRGLDPLLKPVHIVPFGGKEQIIPGINLYSTIAARTGEYVGKDSPVYGVDIQYNGRPCPEWCEVTVYRLVRNNRCAFTSRAYLLERTAGNSQWQKQPRSMLEKCALAAALRCAFPEQVGSLPVEEEVGILSVEEETPDTSGGLAAMVAEIVVEAEVVSSIWPEDQWRDWEIEASQKLYKTNSTQELAAQWKELMPTLAKAQKEAQSTYSNIEAAKNKRKAALEQEAGEVDNAAKGVFQ